MSCSAVSAPTRRTVVSVNGKVIPHSAISREVQNHPAANPVDGWRAAARALAVRELLRQEVERLGVIGSPQSDDEGRVETREEAAMRGLLELEVRTPEPDEETCRRYYANNRQRFCTQTISEASHILIAASRDDVAAREAALEKALLLADHLAMRPDDFETLARENSDCPSGKQGGNLGQLTGGDTAPEFEAALARLWPGEISPAPVESRFGFHIIRLARREEGRQLPFELVHDRIRDYLSATVRRRALAQYVAVLAGRAKLQGVEFDSTLNVV